MPEKPSIAVLPFDNLSGDPNQEFFSDGLTEEIITTLSKIPKIFVIARNSTDTYKNSSAKVQKVSEELGVRYVLEGSVRKDGDRTRITAQFIDAIKGHHLWAERYDRDIKDTFAVQEEISKKILTALEVNLTEGEQAIMMAKGTSSSQAYIKVLQSTYYRRRLNAEDNSKAQRLAEEAIAFDPEYAVAYTTLSRTHVVEAWLRTSKSPRESLAKAMDLANKALSIDDSLADAYDILGNILVLKKNHDEGIRHLERAIELEPNGADFQAHMGMALYLADRSQEAVQVLLKAIRLNPNPPSWYLHNLAVAYNFVENYEEAIFWGEKAVKLDPKSLLGHYILCAIYSSAGRMEDAKREASEVLKIKPNFSVSTLEKTNPLKNESVKKRYFDSLRKAGLPEYPPNEKPVKPSIAVLPFDNMSDDPQQEYFSDGISEDIITDLSKISGLIVIARNSSFTYKGKSVNAQQIGRELQVSYLLEGSVRKAGDKVRINAQLIDASSGHHLWADRYDGGMDDVFALQDKITRKIISALALRLSASEQKAITDKGTDNLEAYDEFLKGWQGYRLLTKAGFADAKTHLEKAVELDPEFTRAYAALAVLYWRAIHFAAPEHRQGLGLNTRQELLAVKAKPQFLVKKAMKKPTALAHGLMSQFYLLRYQHDEALAEIERAVAMDPNDPELYSWMSEILWLMGKSSEAIESANMGLRLDPNNPATYLRQLARSYLPDGDLEESLQLLERAKRINPELSGTVAFHQSVIYGIQGRNRRGPHCV